MVVVVRLNDAREEMDARRQLKASEESTISEKRRELEDKVKDLQSNAQRVKSELEGVRAERARVQCVLSPFPFPREIL